MKSKDLAFFTAGACGTMAILLCLVLCGAIVILKPTGWEAPALPGALAPTAQAAIGTPAPRSGTPGTPVPSPQVAIGTPSPRPGTPGTLATPSAPVAVSDTPPQPLPTRAPGTPAPALATSLRGVLYHDDFGSKEMSETNGWKFEAGDRTELVWSPNKYSMLLKTKNLIHSHAIRGEYKDFGIEIEAQPQDDMMFYGIQFRASKDTKSRYILSFLPGGYMLSKEINGQLVRPALAQSETPHLRPGASKNRLGVLAEGSAISIYINGRLEKTIRDESFSSGGVNVFISMFDYSPSRVQLDLSRVTIFTPEQAKVALPKTDASTAVALNGVLFFGDFSSEQVSKDKGWKFETGEDVDKTWSPSRYSINIKKPGADASGKVGLPWLRDFGIEFEAQPDDVPGMEYGIQFRVSSRGGVYTGFYQLGITLDGAYWLSKKTETEASVLLMRAPSPLIKRGAAKNRLGVLAEGNTISLFINGALVNTIRDDLLDPGSVWLWAYHKEKRVAGVAFSNVTVITPERARVEWGAQVTAGTIVFHDDFSSEQMSRDNGWFLGATQDNAGEMTWSPNRLSLSVKRSGKIRNTSDAFLQNFAVEIEAQPGNDVGTEYGILFNFDAKQGSEYLFHATLDGKYGVMKTIGGKRSENDPVKATPTSLLKPGAKNRLGLLADGSTISLYINGTLVQTFADDSKARGFVGVFVQATGERARVDISRVTILTVNKARAEWASPGVLFHDDFSSEQASKEKGWIFGPSDEADYAWSPHQLTLKVKRDDNLARNYPYGTYRDFGVEIEAQPVSDFVMEYGILLRQSGSKETHSLYYFGVVTTQS
jgi:hypothetical protein